MTGLFSTLRAMIVALPLAGAAAASAAPVASAVEATGSATVMKSLTVVSKDDLDFGTLVAGAAGTAVVDPVTGALSTSGGAVPVGSGAQPAVFTATGSRNSVVLIRIPRDPIVLTRSGGTETMTVSDWTLDGRKLRRIPEGQTFDFAVGATLTVNEGQAEGIYAGSFDVEVQYP